MKYVITRAFALSFQCVLKKVIESLKNEGFGVLQQTDLHAKINTTLEKDMKKYELLMVCHPGFAYEVIYDDLDLGVFLPCTVVVYEKENRVIVSTLQPKILTEKIIKSTDKSRVMQHVADVIERALYTIE